MPPLFPSLLHSTLTLYTLTSDYLLAGDHWILIAPGAPCRRTERWQRLAPVTRTTLIYAICEPLFYALMTRVSNMAIWWGLMGFYLQMTITQGVIKWQLEILKTVNEEHQRDCLESQSQSQSQSREEMTDRYRDDDEAEKEIEEKDYSSPPSGRASPLTAAAQAEAQPPPPPAKCSKHTLPTSYRYASMISASAAALGNAGLIFYVRYLGTADSSEWQSRFAFGWTVVALLVLFCLAFGKWMCWDMGLLCNRRYLDLGKWEIGQRFLTILAMNIIRAAVRRVLGQPAFLSARMGAGVVVLKGVVHAVADPRGKEDGHLMDRAFGWLPVWFTTAASVLNGVGWGSYGLYVFLKGRRETKRAKEEEERVAEERRR